MTILDHPDPPPFHWAEQTVEDELERLVAGLTSQRNERMFMRYQGWDGGGQRPLRIVAEEFGITSERVRQVCRSA